MNNIIYLITSFLIVFSINYGFNEYFIYQFSIDSEDKISIHSSKHIMGELKTSKVKKNIHNSIEYKVIDKSDNVIFENLLSNPKSINFEDFSNDNPLKQKLVLDNTHFSI